MSRNRNVRACALATLGALAAMPNAAADSRIEASATVPGTVWVGPPVSVEASLTSTCTSTEQAWIGGALDDQPPPGLASRRVPAGATIAADVVGIVPATLAPGDHVLTIAMTDSSGSVSMIEMVVEAQPCTSTRVKIAPRATNRRATGR